ncbi:MAG: hypothetical protein ACK4RK_08765 [Gemmataceae bacterium]
MNRKASAKSEGTLPGVSAERATRLYRLVKLVSEDPRTRSDIMDHLGLDVRGFYRDLKLLRMCGIRVTLEDHKYHLQEKMEVVVERLPFPNPHLTVGDMRKLAKGKTPAHQKLSDFIDKILS